MIVSIIPTPILKKIGVLLLLLFAITACSGKERVAPQDGGHDTTDHTNPAVDLSEDYTAILDEHDPFKDYLYAQPEALEVTSSLRVGTGSLAIFSDRLVFKSRGGMNTVFGVVAYPSKQGKYPAILILHGGGGNAEGLKGLAEHYARQGFVAMATDQPGICGYENTPLSTGSWKSRPTGEAPRFEVANGPANSTLVDGLVADLQAFNWLANRSDVDAARIGITGFSWGGYATTFLTGLLRDRVQAAYSIYGSGYYDKDSFWTDIITGLAEATRKTWLKYLDAGRRAIYITAPYFLEAATNDTYFQPTAVMATLEEARPTANWVWGPNLNHQRPEFGEAMQLAYFNHYLKGQGDALHKTTIAASEPQADGAEIISIQVSPTTTQVTAVTLYYSAPTNKWTDRQWIPVDATKNAEGIYQATIPATTTNASYFATVTDKSNRSTSSTIQRVAR